MTDSSVLLVVVLPFLGMWLWAIVEVVRRDDLRVGRTATWLAALLLVAPLALAGYAIARPPRRSRRSGGGVASTDAEQFVVLAERRQRGELGDDEFRHAAGALVAAARTRERAQPPATLDRCDSTSQEG